MFVSRYSTSRPIGNVCQCGPTASVRPTNACASRKSFATAIVFGVNSNVEKVRAFNFQKLPLLFIYFNCNMQACNNYFITVIECIKDNVSESVLNKKSVINFVF